MHRLCGGLLPASSVDSPLTERLLQLLAIVEQNSCQLALLAADHFAGATLIDCFVTLVSGAVAATTPGSAAASGGDSSAAGSVNIRSLNELLRSKEFHSFVQASSLLDLSSHQGQLDLIEEAMMSNLPFLLRVIS